MEQQPTIAIDFDHTIHDLDHPPAGKRMGPPMPGAERALYAFRENGFRIVIFCFWADSEKNRETISKWMDYFQLPYDDITNIKPDAAAYIDNHGIRFENNWPEILEKILTPLE